MALLGSWKASDLKTPTGIAVAGLDVWICDSNTDRAYLYAGAASRLSGSITATRSFVLGAGNTNPQDIATDGTTVWVVHSGAPDKIFVYQASNGAALGNWTIDSANATPTGLTLDPTGASNSLWTVDSGTDRVYEYANGRDLRTGSQAASVSFALNTAGGNTSAQGIADPRQFGDLRPSFTDLDKQLRQVSWRAVDHFIQQQSRAELTATTINFLRLGRPLPKKLSQEQVKALLLKPNPDEPESRGKENTEQTEISRRPSVCSVISVCSVFSPGFPRPPKPSLAK
jgi:hypothetical protein